MTAGRRIVVVLAAEEHADAIAAFYRLTWDSDATTRSVLASLRAAADRNVVAPGTLPPTALVLEGSRVIGYCGSIPQRLWDGATERPAYWLKGLMVLPEYQNGPIGFLAVKELVRHLDCSTLLAVAPAARRLFSALGYTDLGAVSNWIRPLRAGVLADRVDFPALGLNLPRWVAGGVALARRTGVANRAAGAVGLAVDAVAAVTRLSASHLVSSSDDDIAPAELDALWRAARAGIAASTVRDAAYLSGRFGDTAGNPEAGRYSFVTTRERGRLVGVAVVRRPKASPDPRLGGIRVATLSDIVLLPGRSDVGLATLGGVQRLARADDADALTCMTSHPTLSALLRRQAYLRLSGNVHFFLRDVTGAGRWPSDLPSWWLARGDGESDTSF